MTVILGSSVLKSGLSSAKTISNAFAVLIKERLENIKVIPRAILIIFS